MAGYNPDYIKQFYARHLVIGEMSGEECRTSCPGHKDDNPSFSVNLTTGLYKCFAADCKLSSGGGLQKFLAIIENIPVHEAATRINEEYATLYPPVKGKSKKTRAPAKFPFTHDDILARMEYLLSNEEHLKLLQDTCLWTEETIRKYNIGYDQREGIYWVPVIENIEICNIRKYKIGAKYNKWTSIHGFGRARIFPIDNTQNNPLYLMEGEKDCILANQLGLNAITVTGGAGAFSAEWKTFFEGKNVVICYDVDIAGRTGSKKVYSTIGFTAANVKIVELPLKEPPNADFTDYILSGKTVQDFLALVDSTSYVEPPSDSPVDIESDVTDTELDKVDENGLFYKRSKINVRVIGTDSSPYIIPRDVRIECDKDNGRACMNCRVGDKGGKGKLTIDETTPRLLDLIECKTSERSTILRDIFLIPACRKFRLKEKDHQSVNRVSIIPSIDEIHYDEETQNQTYVERDLYFLGSRLIANTDYEIEALAIPSPKDQALVHLGYKVKPADSSIEEFKMTPELKEQLEIFTCTSEKE